MEVSERLNSGKSKTIAGIDLMQLNKDQDVTVMHSTLKAQFSFLWEGF
jgi:hypothetical protein